MRRAVVLAAVTALLGLGVPAASAAPPRLEAGVVQDGLQHPWDVAFSPGGRMLVTERPGRVRVYASPRPGARLLATRTLRRVRAEGEAGVMGIAVQAARKGRRPFVFVCASRSDEGRWRNQVLRYRLGSSGRLDFDGYLIRRGMRAASIHDGCAVEAGAGGRVLVTMGDASQESLPQRVRSYNGKVLRVNRDGTVPRINPRLRGRRSLVYTLGHRNPQGLARRPGTHTWYAVEHGPDRDDEINRLRGGRDYGWPCYTGAGRRYLGCRTANTDPAWASGSPTLATSGGAFVRGRRWGSWRGDFFSATLKEQDLRRFEPSARGRRMVARSVLFNGRYGRLRAAVVNANGHLFLTTSNGGDDKVIRIIARRR